VQKVVIGATKAEGGTRSHTITVGGAATLPFIASDGDIGNRTYIAVDVLDTPPLDWQELLLEPLKDVVDDPGKWAKKAVEEFGADLVCICLDGIHPDKGNRDADHAVKAVTKVKESVGVPLIVWRSGDDTKDNEILPKVSAALKGERVLFGSVTEDNYKRLTGVCMADGHNLVAQAPLDINIAKQVNILVSEMGFPQGRLVMFQTTGALGYGIEYAYSIQERERIAALQGDKMMSMPVIGLAGYEAWRAKETRVPESDMPAWGSQKERAVMWEAMTALALVQSGCDIIRMRHPAAVAAVKKHIDRLLAQ
jgi:acetyl-CoA decarbonylase/synthase complex subunit delta